ncbi:MAG TPA: radical SAM protein [Candidatus Elarobacter sp.]
MLASSVSAPAGIRASSYTIYVDIAEGDGFTLLAHGYTGAYDLVPNAVAAYVRSLDARPPKPLYGTWTDERVGDDVPVPSDATIETLKQRGFLTTMTRAEERAFFDRVIAMKHAHEDATPSYVIMPTYDCNLRCGYCFQDHMRTDASYAHLLRTMTPALIDRTIAALPGIEERHGIVPGSRRRSFMFFGGEPLLARSRPVIERFMTRAREASPAVFAAVTNATELDAYADLLGPEAISLLQITVDGPRARHDARRVYADGSGSFDRIAANVDLALSRGVSVDVRMNVDRGNAAELPALAEFFAERGWPDHPGFSSYAAPVHATNPSIDRKSCFNGHELNEALAALRAEHPAMAAITTRDDGLRSRLRRVMRDGADPMPRMMKASYCGAHTGMYVIDAFGDIYACWERTGDKNVRIGWIGEDGRAELVADRLAGWRSRTVSTNETCAQCRYAMYCGGGCAVLAEDVHGTMFGNYCDAFGRRFRHAVRDAYATRNEALPHDDRVLELRAL